ncbi:MAG: hypothetical protein KAR79_04850 [Simkaniaceae bacterium]|nr:hypothetical protein [Simkaniaceae bacterium]
MAATNLEGMIGNLEVHAQKWGSTRRFGGAMPSEMIRSIHDQGEIIRGVLRDGADLPGLSKAVELYNELAGDADLELIEAAERVADVAEAHFLPPVDCLGDEAFAASLATHHEDCSGDAELAARLAGESDLLPDSCLGDEELAARLAEELNLPPDSCTADAELAARLQEEGADGGVRAPMQFIHDENPLGTLGDLVFEFSDNDKSTEEKNVDLINKLGECMPGDGQEAFFTAVQGNYYGKWLLLHPELALQHEENWFQNHISDNLDELVLAIEEECAKIAPPLEEVVSEPLEIDESAFTQLSNCIASLQYKSGADADEKAFLIGLMRQLGEEIPFFDANAMLGRYWELSGRPDEAEYSERHLTDNLPHLDRAMREILSERLDGAELEFQNTVHGQVYLLNGSPETGGDGDWGRTHRADDLAILITAIQNCSR